MSINKIIKMLKDMTNEKNKKKLEEKVNIFSKLILESDDETGHKLVDDLLLKFAVELQHFEPSKIQRSKSKFYFGEKELMSKLDNTLKEIKKALSLISGNGTT